MPLDRFLRDLFEHGRLKVAAPRGRLSTEEQAAAEQVLMEQEALCRGEFPGIAPPLDLPAAMWAAEMFHRACQLMVYRDLDEEAIAELLAAPCPTCSPASQHWSVDLVFRFLPDLIRHATRAAEGDPLVERLRGWAAEWPLSSVGMHKVLPRRVPELVADRGLGQLYLDRILAKKDFSRLAEPTLREPLRAAIGGHQQLWPELEDYLQPLLTLS
ncbi:MAG: hypothetical protein SFU86_20310 [Pirellulaceae bacterium]|nr:hypothetical protein [Pirellulaceae bacterium]